MSIAFQLFTITIVGASKMGLHTDENNYPVDVALILNDLKKAIDDRVYIVQCAI